MFLYANSPIGQDHAAKDILLCLTSSIVLTTIGFFGLMIVFIWACEKV